MATPYNPMSLSFFNGRKFTYRLLRASPPSTCQGLYLHPSTSSQITPTIATFAPQAAAVSRGVPTALLIRAQLSLAGPVRCAGCPASSVTQPRTSRPLAPQSLAPHVTHPAALGTLPLTPPSRMTRGPSFPSPCRPCRLHRWRSCQGPLKPRNPPPQWLSRLSSCLQQ